LLDRMIHPALHITMTTLGLFRQGLRLIHDRERFTVH